MPSFRYVCRKRDGTDTRGVLDADSLASATSTLEQLGLEIITLEPEIDVVNDLDGFQRGVSFAPGSSLPPLPSAREAEYYPLTDTLRLYAGWLLVWYIAIYALGSYQLTRSLPFHSKFLSTLTLSPIVLFVSFAAFLFLLLTSIHRLLGRGIITGCLLLFVGVGIFAVFQLNV